MEKICILCKKSFTNDHKYNLHINRKTSCIDNRTIYDLLKIKDNKIDEMILKNNYYINKINNFIDLINKLDDKIKKLEYKNDFHNNQLINNKSVTYTDDNFINIFCETVKNENDSKRIIKNIWKESKYKIIDELKNDSVGRIGENFIKSLFEKLEYNVIYNNDKIDKNGVFDMIINDKKIEIKTARIGMSNKFQHENLRNNGSDFYIFLDVAPNCIFFTILKHFNLNNKNIIINKKAHLRKETTNVYKLDFSLNDISKYLKNNITITIDNTTRKEKLVEYINKSFL